MTKTKKEKIKKAAKWTLQVSSKKGTQKIDIHSGKRATGEMVTGLDQGWAHADDTADLKETLCWCFNADPDMFLLEWGMSDSDGTTHGTVYLCD